MTHKYGLTKSEHEGLAKMLHRMRVEAQRKGMALDDTSPSSTKAVKKLMQLVSAIDAAREAMQTEFFNHRRYWLGDQGWTNGRSPYYAEDYDALCGDEGEDA